MVRCRPGVNFKEGSGGSGLVRCRPGVSKEGSPGSRMARCRPGARFKEGGAGLQRLASPLKRMRGLSSSGVAERPFSSQGPLLEGPKEPLRRRGPGAALGWVPQPRGSLAARCDRAVGHWDGLAVFHGKGMGASRCKPTFNCSLAALDALRDLWPPKTCSECGGFGVFEGFQRVPERVPSKRAQSKPMGCAGYREFGSALRVGNA